MSHPDTYTRLQNEVDKFFPQGEDPMDPAKHVHMPYLNAVMCAFFLSVYLKNVNELTWNRNETLRLLPPVPSGSQRASAQGGAIGP